MGQPKVKATAAWKVNLHGFFISSIILFAVAVGATLVNAQGKVTKSHGISTFGELKYPPDFKHW